MGVDEKKDRFQGSTIHPFGIKRNLYIATRPKFLTDSFG